MKYLMLLVFPSLVAVTGCTQGGSQQSNSPKDREAGGRCEGCEAIFESPVSFEKLNWTDTLPGFLETEPKLLVSGKVFKIDGKTPAANVVLYFYHTDREGNYPQKGDEKGWGKRHGFLRGWVKTNDKGEYRFFTFRPASYPNSNNPQHIHITVKEEGVVAYYIDDFLFADDPLLREQEKGRLQKRGGSGLLRPELKNGMYVAQRDIVLGKNVPGY
ncbi:MAG: dioxygenase family protein [Flavisolibacter sp.]